MSSGTPPGQREQVREFLTTRRARLTPELAGLGTHRGHRRVAGLRRGEVADLAGVSVEYYSRLERGDLREASPEVLDAIAGALQMDEAEHSHLLDLARAAGPARSTGRRGACTDGRQVHQLRPHLLHLLEAMTAAPAFVRNGRLDVLAINALGCALYSPVFPAGHLEVHGDDATSATTATVTATATATATATSGVNLARFCFLDPAARGLYPDWDATADTTVALLRTEAGRAPHDRALSDLVGELSVRSEDFRTRWAAHEVRLHRSGTKHFTHPIVGGLNLDFTAFPVDAESGLTLTAYTAPPGSPAADGLALLASWATTPHEFAGGTS